MKSVYELAMERLQASDPDSRNKLSEAQKQQLAEIDKVYKAKVAERDVFLKKQLAEVRSQGNRIEEEALLKQIASERQLLEEEMESKKDAVRKGTA